MFSHEYETIIIIRPDIEDSAVFGIAEKVESIVLGSNGHVLDREDWGKRKLSYPIAKHQRGHYLRLNFLCAPSLVAEIERRIRNEDDVVRFMTLRLATEVDAPTRIEQAAIQRARREEEAKRRQQEAEAGLDEYDEDGYSDDDDDDNMGESR